MRYLGGKTRNARAISDILKKARKENQVYFEPFCGGLSVAVKMDGVCVLNDLHEGLITLFKSIQRGEFEYPTTFLNETSYNIYKKEMNLNDPMTTFVGFGLSYGGKWWGGYDSYYDRREKLGHTTTMAVNSLRKKFALPHIKEAEFHSKSYTEFRPENQLIYCDPPYQNTTLYKGVDDFDHLTFWDTMRGWSKNNTVIISEFSAPDDFFEIWSAGYKVQMCKEQQYVVEKLFMI